MIFFFLFHYYETQELWIFAKIFFNNKSLIHMTKGLIIHFILSKAFISSVITYVQFCT